MSGQNAFHTTGSNPELPTNNASPAASNPGTGAAKMPPIRRKTVPPLQPVTAQPAASSPSPSPSPSREPSPSSSTFGDGGGLLDDASLSSEDLTQVRPGTAPLGRASMDSHAISAVGRARSQSSLGQSSRGQSTVGRPAPEQSSLGKSSPGKSSPGQSGLGQSGLGLSSPGLSSPGNSALGRAPRPSSAPPTARGEASPLSVSSLGTRGAVLPPGADSGSSDQVAIGEISDIGFPADLRMSDVHPAVGRPDTLDIDLEPIEDDASGASERSLSDQASVEQLEINRRRRGKLTGAHAPAPERNSVRRSVVRGSTAGNPPVSASASGPATTEPAPSIRWKVRTSSGMVYDFPDTGSLTHWLSSRTTLDDLDVSSDAGATFTPVSAHATFSGVKAHGYRTAAVRVPVSVRSHSGSGLLQLPTRGNSGAIPRVNDSGSTSGVTTLTAGSGVHTVSPGSGASAPTAESGSDPAVEESPAEPRATRKRTKEQKKAKSSFFGRASSTSKKAKKPKKSTKAKKKTKRTSRDKSSVSQNSKLGLLVFLLVVVSAIAGGYFKLTAAPSIPNTPAGRQFAWALGAMNGGVNGINEAEIIEHFAPSALEVVEPGVILRELRFWYDRNPGYIYNGTLHGRTPTRLEGRVSTVAQDHGIITVGVEPDPPHRIIEFHVRGAPQPNNPTSYDMEF